MAAPTYVTASTGASDTTGAWTATGAAPGAAGRIMILHVVQDGTTDGSVTFTSATNIENLAGTDNAWTAIGEYSMGGADEARHYLWIGRSLSTSTPTFTGGNSSGEDLFFRMYEFSGVSTGTTLATVIENVTAGTATSAGATSTTVADVGVTTLGPDRLALNFIGVNDDAQAAELTAMTGESGGDWTYPVAAYGDSAGTDATLALVTATIASAGTINGGTDTITSGAWGVVGFALKPTGIPLLTQAAYRYYEDGTEAGATAIANQDTNITRDVSAGDSNLQLRVRLQETDGTDGGPSTDDYQLQYELNDSGTYLYFDTALADSYPNSNFDSLIAITTAGDARGQSFTGNGGSLRYAYFYVSASSAVPTGTVVAKIYAHTGTFGTSSVGTGAALATSDTISIDSIGTNAVEFKFAFSGVEQITLTNGTNYVVVVDTTGVTMGGGNIRLNQDITSPTHAGNRVNLLSSAWSATSTSDIGFAILTAGGSVVGYNSASLTDGNATTNRLGSGTGSFVAGEISEDGLVDDLQITASNYTELLYSLTIESTAVADNDTLDFRVLRNGATTGMTYTVTPRITIEESTTSAVVTGTIVPTATEADIVAGGKTLIITLTGDTWIAAGALSFDLQRQNIINGVDSAQGETFGWNLVPQAAQSVGGVVRTSDTVVTITWDAFATYDITATETITVTVPATAVTGGNAIVATPTFSITAAQTTRALAALGVG